MGVEPAGRRGTLSLSHRSAAARAARGRGCPPCAWRRLTDARDVLAAAGVPFPKSFQTTVKLIFKRLFRVYAHMYYSHFQKVVSLNEEAHLNTSFKVAHRERDAPYVRSEAARTDARLAWA
jgi:hypothetical protein